jgi:hypothetical protein
MRAVIRMKNRLLLAEARAEGADEPATLHDAAAHELQA